MKKRIIAALATLCLLVTLLPASFAAGTAGTVTLKIGSPSMSINGVAQAIDEQGTSAVLLNPGYTMLPLRAMVEAMGGTVTWNESAQTITIVLSGHTVVVTIGSATATLDGTNFPLQHAPYLTTGGRTMVHIRTLEAFTGVACTWDNNSQTVTVKYDFTTIASTAKSVTLYLCNATGEEVSKVEATPTGTANWITVSSSSVANNAFKTAVFNMTYSSKWSFQATTSKGTWTGAGIDLSSYKNGDSVYLYMLDGNKYKLGTKTGEYKNNSAAGEVTIRIYNESDYDFTRVSISPADEGDWETLISSTIDDGNYDYEDYDRDGETNFDFRISTDGDGTYYLYDVDLSDYDDDDTVKLTVTGNKKYKLDGSSSSSSSDTEVKLYFYNDTGDDYYFDQIYASPQGDDDWDRIYNSSDIEDGDRTSAISFDISDDTRWDFRIRMYDEDDDSEYWYCYKVNLSSYDDGDTVRLYIYDDDDWELK